MSSDDFINLKINVEEGTSREDFQNLNYIMGKVTEAMNEQAERKKGWGEDIETYRKETAKEYARQIGEKIIRASTVQALDTILKDKYADIREGTKTTLEQKEAYSKGGRSLTNSMSSMLGDFTEVDFFGASQEKGRATRAADLQDLLPGLNAELKATQMTTPEPVQVAGITLYADSEAILKNYNKEEVRLALATYKFASKMLHFVFLWIENDPNEPARIRFKMIKLFSELILEKLIEKIKQNTIFKAEFQTSTPKRVPKGKSGQEKWWSQKYNVRINFTQKYSIKDIEDMYYIVSDILAEIKNNYELIQRMRSKIYNVPLTELSNVPSIEINEPAKDWK